MFSLFRGLLPLEVYQAVFACTLQVARAKGLLDGEMVSVDLPVLEVKQSVRSIVRRDIREYYRTYVRHLMQEAGAIGPDETPKVEDMKRFDQSPQGRTVSNPDWERPSIRIAVSPR